MNARNFSLSRLGIVSTLLVCSVACATGTNVATDDEELVGGTDASATTSTSRPTPTPPASSSGDGPSPSTDADASRSVPPEVDASDGSTRPTPPVSTTGNVVNGSVNGLSIAASDGFSLVTAMGARVTSAAVALQNKTGGCSDYGVGRERPNLAKLRVQVYVNPTSSASLTPGTFTLGSSGGVFADASVSLSDTSCLETIGSPANRAIAGTVTFTAFQPAAVGTFDLTFPGGRYTGSFDAPQCTKNPAGSTTCTP